MQQFLMHQIISNSLMKAHYFEFCLPPPTIVENKENPDSFELQNKCETN